jgi:hypothetical protein
MIPPAMHEGIVTALILVKCIEQFLAPLLPRRTIGLPLTLII